MKNNEHKNVHSEILYEKRKAKNHSPWMLVYFRHGRRADNVLNAAVMQGSIGQLLIGRRLYDDCICFANVAFSESIPSTPLNGSLRNFNT